MKLPNGTIAALMESDEESIANGISCVVTVTPLVITAPGPDDDPANDGDVFSFNDIGSAATIERIEGHLARGHQFSLEFANVTDGEACLRWLRECGSEA